MYIAVNTTYTAIYRDYTTDAIGQPLTAGAPKLSQKTSPRSPCETTVGGRWPAGYQGGHLIAATPARRESAVALAATTWIVVAVWRWRRSQW